jgi:hypothetical protein
MERISYKMEEFPMAMFDYQRVSPWKTKKNCPLKWLNGIRYD